MFRKPLYVGTVVMADHYWKIDLRRREQGLLVSQKALGHINPAVLDPYLEREGLRFTMRHFRGPWLLVGPRQWPDKPYAEAIRLVTALQAAYPRIQERKVDWSFNPNA